MTPRFRDDNTEGYTPDDLAALNEAFEAIIRENINPYPPGSIEYKSWQDDDAEILLARYDAGLRGDQLTG